MLHLGCKTGHGLRFQGQIGRDVQQDVGTQWRPDFVKSNATMTYNPLEGFDGQKTSLAVVRVDFPWRWGVHQVNMPHADGFSQLGNQSLICNQTTVLLCPEFRRAITEQFGCQLGLIGSTGWVSMAIAMGQDNHLNSDAMTHM